MGSEFKPILVYFQIKGKGEVTRHMFALAGVEFEDKRYSFKEWGMMRATGNKIGF